MSGREAVLRLFARERLLVDGCAAGRTTFISHLGSIARLDPGPWIAHRELVLALALANLTPAQRRSLARAVLVDHGREFGVGRLVLETCPSGLPLGGSSLLLRPRAGGPRCLYTWALGSGAAAAACEWLLLRAEPGWALEGGPAPLQAEAVATAAALHESVVIFAATAGAARQIADACLVGRLPFTAHPRFLPHLDGASAGAGIALWPHDAAGAASLARRRAGAAIVVDGPEAALEAILSWAATSGVEVTTAGCPGAIDRARLAALWRACGSPQVLLRGDPGWARAGLRWLGELGAAVEPQSDATQLGLFG